MKNLFLLLLLAFCFSSCNKEEIPPQLEEEIIINSQNNGPKALFTITIPFEVASCKISGKTLNKFYNELDSIKAIYPNLALVQVTGNAWEGSYRGTQFCDCRAAHGINYYNLWAQNNGLGQSSGIAFCQNHIRSGPENQTAVLLIDAFF